MCMRKVWIEAALNGPWGRERQPLMPISVDELISEGISACKAGAAIIHLHAYDTGTGLQKDDWELYAAVIEGIRSKVDALVYPTIPLAGSGYAGSLCSPKERYRHVQELAVRDRLEIAAVDPGSVNFIRFDEAEAWDSGFVYQNPTDHIREGLHVMALHGIRPSFAIYEPGFTRAGAALSAVESNLLLPLYRFMFSDEFAWGFPPSDKYLAAHLSLLEEVAPDAPWMVAGLGVNILRLASAAVERGGHIRVGLEDAPWNSVMTNVQWVEAAVRSFRTPVASRLLHPMSELI